VAVGIRHLFAGIAARNYAQALPFYERLLGRPPDMLPTEGEALWHLRDGASVYLVGDASRAGNGLVTIAVDNLARHLAELAERLPDAVIERSIDPLPQAMITDPDGNQVKFFEDPAASRESGAV
jgi:catechol 2,3-dioxygenase-like lactoylglutathione lyase family enzyme